MPRRPRVPAHRHGSHPGHSDCSGHSNRPVPRPSRGLACLTSLLQPQPPRRTRGPACHYDNRPSHSDRLAPMRYRGPPHLTPQPLPKTEPGLFGTSLGTFACLAPRRWPRTGPRLLSTCLGTSPK
ncbi:hypothetical protein AMTR_s00074p00184650 [Amborella trichopoda]|uniref:Uncharacterized protein n=1 Tax=Amborella trichopoda TaxID=13333 RepID=W1NQB7_AMBTC|nr:hypothetical protein AMTR_s00074p00184650 [Amborella trichopoda]